MEKLKSLADLKRIREEAKEKLELRVKGDNPEGLVQVKVAMATCGIASGAKPIMDFFVDELDKRGIGAIVTQTGCMGYCYAEPTIELTVPGQAPVVYGYVNKVKAQEIIEKHIKLNQMVDGIIPVSYSTIDNN